MKDQAKTKKQLINELLEIRQRLAEVEGLDDERRQIETALQDHVERQRALHELHRAITASLRLNEVYHAFSRHASRLLPYDRIAICLLNGNEIQVAYVAGDQTSETSLPVGTPLSPHVSGVGRVIAQGQPLLRHNLTAKSHFAEDEQLVEDGIRSSMIIPLRAKGKIIGTLNIDSIQVGAFNPDDLELAQSMADQLAGALENAHLYEQARQEIKERQRAEEALRESREHFRRVIVSISDHIYMGVYTGDLTGRPTPASFYISPNVENLLGYPLEKFETDWNFWRSLIHPDDLDRATVKLANLPKGGKSQIEYRISHADGRQIWIRDSRQFEVENNQLGHLERVAIYGVVSDITEHKQLEEQLYQAQKMEAIGRLAGGIAHDFNNLLTVINGNSELLLHRYLADDSPERQIAEQVKTAGDRAASLTRQLLTFSRKQVLQPRLLDLNEVISNIEQMLRRLIGEDINLDMQLTPDLGLVKVDPTQMDQVIINLAINARDAMSRGGDLTIETVNIDLDKTDARQQVGVKPGAYVRLTISDTGHGMDEATKVRIFEPFFTTKERGRGTGLGLATVHGIISQSQGHIRVQSEPGRGTTFEIYLPRIEGSAAASERGRTSTESLRGSETVLLVEDEEMVRELAREVLQQEGYTILEASHGSEAIQVCEQQPHPIDLLVTDVVMPGGISGVDLARHLAPIYPQMRVLYISGYTDNTITQHGVIDDTIAFLEKPFSLRALTRKVREVLD